jgi:tRNA (cmo5U34)-methyltransferase
MNISLSSSFYDDRAERQIPGYRSLARLAVALLSGSPTAAVIGSPVLVVGCGTGAELLEARAQRGDWQLTAVDPDAAMLRAAQERLGAAAKDVDWVHGPVENLPGERRFAAATAVLVLQELADNGAKLDFLVSLARLLQPGAPLLLLDLMGGGTGLNNAMEQQFQAALRQFQKASGLELESPVIIPGLHPIGEARRSALLDAAGFSDPITVFQALQYEGVVALRRR